MNNHIKKTVEKIKEVCDQFEQKKINLQYMQSLLSAFCMNFENDIPLDIQRNTENLIEDLEYIHFMRREDEHFESVLKKIRDYKKSLSVYFQS